MNLSRNAIKKGRDIDILLEKSESVKSRYDELQTFNSNPVDAMKKQLE